MHLSTTIKQKKTLKLYSVIENERRKQLTNQSLVITKSELQDFSRIQCSADTPARSSAGITFFRRRISSTDLAVSKQHDPPTNEKENLYIADSYDFFPNAAAELVTSSNGLQGHTGEDEDDDEEATVAMDAAFSRRWRLKHRQRPRRRRRRRRRHLPSRRRRRSG